MGPRFMRIAATAAVIAVVVVVVVVVVTVVVVVVVAAPSPLLAKTWLVYAVAFIDVFSYV